MNKQIDVKRYKETKERYYHNFDECCVDYSVIDCMCLDSMDLVNEIIDKYESALAEIAALIRYYEEICTED